MSSHAKGINLSLSSPSNLHPACKQKAEWTCHCVPGLDWDKWKWLVKGRKEKKITAHAFFPLYFYLFFKLICQSHSCIKGDFGEPTPGKYKRQAILITIAGRIGYAERVRDAEWEGHTLLSESGGEKKNKRQPRILLTFKAWALHQCC